MPKASKTLCNFCLCEFDQKNIQYAILDIGYPSRILEQYYYVPGCKNCVVDRGDLVQGVRIFPKKERVSKSKTSEV
ncbi:hypothetical protein EBU71_11995 [bacterium]|jgi:hypothetical protein|nr:hypothetical protein [Candidatus Elulimicrobium humile]